MNMMRQAGYKSFWITNQQTMTKRNTMLTTFSKYTDKQVYLNNTRLQNSRQYDGDVLEPFAEALQDPAPRKLIVLHLLGTHMKYKYRYPDEYIHFKDNTNLAPVLSENKVEVINSYDNAVLYNDFVVSNIIKTYEKSQQNGFLVYFSDHGEDVYEAPGYNVLGRNEASPTLPMYAVPFLLWMTPEWRAKMPEISNDVLERPYSMSHFIHTWADLAGLQFTDYEPHKSLINPAFETLPLLVGDPNNPKSLKILPKAK
jgi:heptose-I-phosphate ethanolaminephosphotransferase